LAHSGDCSGKGQSWARAKAEEVIWYSVPTPCKRGLAVDAIPSVRTYRPRDGFGLVRDRDVASIAPPLRSRRRGGPGRIGQGPRRYQVPGEGIRRSVTERRRATQARPAHGWVGEFPPRRDAQPGCSTLIRLVRRTGPRWPGFADSARPAARTTRPSSVDARRVRPEALAIAGADGLPSGKGVRAA
jgi:hypothetical protein